MSGTFNRYSSIPGAFTRYRSEPSATNRYRNEQGTYDRYRNERSTHDRYRDEPSTADRFKNEAGTQRAYSNTPNRDTHNFTGAQQRTGYPNYTKPSNENNGNKNVRPLNAQTDTSSEEDLANLLDEQKN